VHFKEKISPPNVALCAWCIIHLRNHNYEPQYFQLFLARFGLVRLGSACRVNEVLMSLGGFYSVELPECF
jgi:hypothetical protein